MSSENPYDARYGGEEYYWSVTPSTLCERVIEIMRSQWKDRPRLLDLGCGEGRDIVYFARHGFDVTGLDASSVGLKKAKTLAERFGITIKTICGDVTDCEIGSGYDVIFSTGVMHYIPPDLRRRRFEQIKQATDISGINAISALVVKPFLVKAPDADENVILFESGELLSYYADWEIIYSSEEIFDCNSGGVPHRHAISRVIARRYAGG